MDGYLRQSTASQSRLIGPFIDDTDFKTAETGLTVANTDIKLRANGTTLSNKNSGGGTHQVNGMYSVTWDATDTANVGELFYSVAVSGALQVFGSYTVLEEAVYDAFFEASAPGYVSNAPVNVQQFGGSNGTFSSGRPEVNTTHAAGTAWASGAITAAAIASDAITAAKVAADVGAEIADAVWDEALAGHLTAGSTGEALDNAGSVGTPPTAAAIADAVWDEAIAGHVSAGSTGEALGNADAEAALDTALTLPGAETTPSAPSLRTALAWVFKFATVKRRQTATQTEIFDITSTTVDHKATVSKSSTEVVRTKFIAGP